MYKTAIIMTIATTAFADLGGVPTEYYHSEIFGESWEANITASVYTDDDQQDWFGVPEDGILISYTITNSENSQSEIEDVDMFVGTKSEDLDGFAFPGYFSFDPLDLLNPNYNAPDYVEFSYETGLYNWDWGSEGNDLSSGLRPGEQATLFIFAYTDSWIESPGIVQGDSDAGIFFTLVPELEAVPIPAPGSLALLGLSCIGKGRRRK